MLVALALWSALRIARASLTIGLTTDRSHGLAADDDWWVDWSGDDAFGVGDPFTLICSRDEACVKLVFGKGSKGCMPKEITVSNQRRICRCWALAIACCSDDGEENGSVQSEDLAEAPFPVLANRKPDLPSEASRNEKRKVLLPARVLRNIYNLKMPRITQ